MPGMPPLDHVTDWVFDLDNTLYPASCNLFAQVDVRIGQYIETLLDLDPIEARRVQKTYFRENGTTLRGLMDNHQIDPADFLDHVHAIDYSPVPPSPRLDQVLSDLNGRKLIFTNGSVRHAENVMERLGVAHHFADIFDIVAADYQPKPEPEPYRELIRRYGLTAASTVLFEDIARNLAPAAALGMTTVWVRTDIGWSGDGAAEDYVHHVADDLVDWLLGVADARGADAPETTASGGELTR